LKKRHAFRLPAKTLPKIKRFACKKMEDNGHNEANCMVVLPSKTSSRFDCWARQLDFSKAPFLAMPAREIQPEQ